MVDRIQNKTSSHHRRRHSQPHYYSNYNVIIVLLVFIVSNFHIHCGPSAQQEHELLLLDALSRKQPLNSNLNAISNNNYETNAIMDMLGRSM
jgi:hypothetical protein